VLARKSRRKLDAPCAAAPKLHETNTKRLFPSKWVFPIYKFDPSDIGSGACVLRHHRCRCLQPPTTMRGCSGGRLVESNFGHSLILSALFATMVWGLLAGVLVRPHFVGWLGAHAGGAVR
jgi:hypothetical protein